MQRPNIQRLLDIMARLRTPEDGCPWDIEQTFTTIAPHTIEETYELVEAIENDDPKAIKEELGDVLFQVVFHAQMGREAGLFDFESVAGYVADKMVERHPHVFGDRDAKTAHDVLVNWEKDKAEKRSAGASKDGYAPSALDGVSLALPASTRAIKLQKRAARVGFDWDKAEDVLAKIREEINELEAERTQKKPKAFLEDELGDVFFAVTNLARKLDIDPETALRRTNKKFERRFRAIEKALAARGKTPADATLDEMEALWNAAKAEEKKS
ncbi:MAG: nucleoside triphosphate pyrophosphohydrolase [Alphaproteobacteria bacterium]|nr:nucleoside triphosphate pyrophosphohydrolase [Alphaproteobacteria bacterium]